MANKGYTTLNLPTELVEELKVWRTAFILAYGGSVSYGKMIRGMIDSLVDTEPAVVKEMDSLLEKHPELICKLSNYKGDDKIDINS